METGSPLYFDTEEQRRAAWEEARQELEKKPLPYYVTEELRTELERTARHLAGKPLILGWSFIQAKHPVLGRQLGQCSLVNGQLAVILDPRNDFKTELYSVFLHETAHALYRQVPFNYWAGEKAADDQARVWAASTAIAMGVPNWWFPRDIEDLQKRLELLRTFGREKHIFSWNGKRLR